MIGVDELGSLPKEQYEALRDKRVRLLNMYCGTDGSEVLLGIIRNARVFDVVDPKDESQNGARNFVICMLQELGLFDEDYVLKCIRDRQRYEVIPKWNGDDEEKGIEEDGGF